MQHVRAGTIRQAGKLVRVRRLRPGRLMKDLLATNWMKVTFVIVLLLPFLLAMGLFIESLPLIKDKSLIDLLFSGVWKPMDGRFGFLPFLISSVWVTFLAIVISGPICLLTAIFLTQYARKAFQKIMQPVVDILAGMPSVIYGVWGVVVIVPLISNYIAPFFGKEVTGFSILAGAIVLSIMIIPFILNIMIEVFNSIPKELTEASLSMGATHWDTVKKVLMRKAFPGVISSMGLGVSRAFGETIAVLMVVGNVALIPKGVFQSGYPLPALIANNYGEMMSIPRYQAALMFGALMLFVVVSLFNIASRYMIIHYEKKI